MMLSKDTTLANIWMPVGMPMWPLNDLLQVKSSNIARTVCRVSSLAKPNSNAALNNPKGVPPSYLRPWNSYE